MNGRRSRQRRRERSLAARGLAAPPTSPDAAEQLLRLRQVRDEKLADNGRRRLEDLALIEAYYREERQQIWSQFHEIATAIRDGKKLVFSEPQLLEAQPGKLTWLGRLRALLRRPQPLPPVEAT